MSTLDDAVKKRDKAQKELENIIKQPEKKDGDRFIAQWLARKGLEGVDYFKWLKELNPLYWHLYGIEKRN